MQRLLDFLEYLLWTTITFFIVISPYNREYTKLSFFSAVGIWLVSKLLRHRLRFFRFLIPGNFLNQPLLVLFFACAFSIVLSLDFYQSQKVFFNRYLLYVTIFWLGIDAGAQNKKSLPWFIGGIIASSIFMGLGGVWDYFVLQPVRLYTVFGLRPAYCMLPLYLVYLIPLNFACAFFSDKKWLKLLSLVGFFLLSLCLVLQKSRSGWVAVAVSLFVISLFKGRKFCLKTVLSILVLFAIGFLFSGSRAMIKTLPHPDQWNNRVPLYASSLEMFKDHPVTGAGVGMFQVLIKTEQYCLPKDYPLMDTVYKDIYLHAHNVYFELLAEMGVMGLTAFLLIFAVYFIRVFRGENKYADRERLGCSVGIAGMVAASLVYGISATIFTVGVNESLLFWFIFGFGAALLTEGKGYGGDIRQPG